MRVIQLVGPGYSGSTAIGFMLNANDGWFFGSEIYRLLASRQQKRPSRGATQCSVCGPRCPFWTQALRSEILSRAEHTVADIYRAFAKAHPAVDSFVDGSKAASLYRRSWSDVQVITAKHPLRMVTSYLYNQPRKLGFKRSPEFSVFRAAGEKRSAEFIALAQLVMRRLLREYENVLQTAPNGLVCPTDELHLNTFEQFRRLCNHVGAPFDRGALQKFSAFPVHPIGGNKAPLWQRMDAAVARAEPAAPNVRRRYYSHSAQAWGDYRIDNKFEEILPVGLRDEVMDLRAYAGLCDLLQYDPIPVVGGTYDSSESTATGAPDSASLP